MINIKRETKIKILVFLTEVFVFMGIPIICGVVLAVAIVIDNSYVGAGVVFVCAAFGMVLLGVVAGIISSGENGILWLISHLWDADRFWDKRIK